MELQFNRKMITKGMRVTVTYGDESAVGVVVIASSNGRSIAVALDGTLYTPAGMAFLPGMGQIVLLSGEEDGASGGASEGLRWTDVLSGERIELRELEVRRG